MIGICATSSDLNGWSTTPKLLQIGIINSSIHFEARVITINVANLLENDYICLGINHDNVDDIKKLTFENVNKIKGVSGNLMKGLKAQFEYRTNAKKLSQLEIEFKKFGRLTKSASIVIF